MLRTEVLGHTPTSIGQGERHEHDHNHQVHAVTGMTCSHCIAAVSAELGALTGVTDVHVDLVAGGISTVTVSSDTPLTVAQVATALDEAGDYRLSTDQPR